MRFWFQELSGGHRDRLAGAIAHGTEVKRSCAILFASVVGSFLNCASLLLYGSGRGLDLTDEIFYLIWARDPHAYGLMYQPFGYLLHPLFSFVDGDLQAYRLAGFAMAAAAGAFVGFSLSHADRRRALFTFYGAAAGLSTFFPWIITPSYNSAADVGGLLIIGGILNVLADRSRTQAVGTIAVGAGICIAAFAKPPLFAIAVLVMLITACLAQSASAKLALIGGLVLGVALISLFLPLAEVPGVIRQIITTQHALALPNTPLALPAKVARDWLAVPLVLSLSAALAVLSFVIGRIQLSRWPAYLAVALGLCYIVSVLPDAIDGNIPDFVGLALVIVAAGYAALVRPDQRRTRTAVLLLIGAPIAVALGTFNNQWFQVNFSLPFPLLALFQLASADRYRWRSACALASAVVAPAAALVLAASAPYSLPTSIFDQQVAIEATVGRGSILVDEETAAFVRSARGLARGALLIDLSGTGPGVAAVLGAKSPVLPWLNPATPAWADVVWSRLSADERESAWFVVPVWPLFKQSAPAMWLVAHQTTFCRTRLPETPFWGQERTLELWRPCSAPSQIYAQESAPLRS